LSQGTIIVGILFVMFAVFITAKGELPTYLGFLFSKSTTTQQVKGGPTNAASSGTTLVPGGALSLPTPSINLTGSGLNLAL
jgi:hypothetical protein